MYIEQCNETFVLERFLRASQLSNRCATSLRDKCAHECNPKVRPFDRNQSDHSNQEQIESIFLKENEIK